MNKKSKKDTCCTISSISNMKCNHNPKFNELKYFYNPETNEIFDELGNYIGQGYIDNGILIVKRKTAHP